VAVVVPYRASASLEEFALDVFYPFFL